MVIVWRIGCEPITVPLWAVMHLRFRAQLYRTGRAATGVPYPIGTIRPRRDQRPPHDRGTARAVSRSRAFERSTCTGSGRAGYCRLMLHALHARAKKKNRWCRQCKRTTLRSSLGRASRSLVWSALGPVRRPPSLMLSSQWRHCRLPLDLEPESS